MVALMVFIKVIINSGFVIQLFVCFVNCIGILFCVFFDDDSAAAIYGRLDGADFDWFAKKKSIRRFQSSIGINFSQWWSFIFCYIISYGFYLRNFCLSCLLSLLGLFKFSLSFFCEAIRFVLVESSFFVYWSLFMMKIRCVVLMVEYVFLLPKMLMVWW